MKQHLYIAHPDYFNELAEEINHFPNQTIMQQHGLALLVKGNRLNLSFAQDTWYDCQIESATSIQRTADNLNAKGKNWVCYKPKFFRRSSLIEKKIHRYSLPPLSFPNSYHFVRPNCWTLLEAESLLYSSTSTSIFPLGQAKFAENRQAPSRAYLKLWEFFLATGKVPTKGSRCLDLGSSPGGWTWVLDQLGCEIISVDRSPLVQSLKNKRNIKNLCMDAFRLKCEDIGPVDWLFSDLICYPEKLLQLVNYWRSNSNIKNFVCTIKFQGATDFSSIKNFLSIPNSKIIHLSVNKHELTWYLTTE